MFGRIGMTINVTKLTLYRELFIEIMSMSKMKTCLLTLLLLATIGYGNINAKDVAFSNNAKSVVKVTPEKNTGLDAIYVLSDVVDVEMSFDSGDVVQSKWYRYSNLGGGYAEEINGVEQSGTVSTLRTIEGDMGYIIETGDSRYYFWVVDYSKHVLSVNSLSFSNEDECGETSIVVDGYGDAIKYFTINGQQRNLDRKIEVVYNDLEWNAESKLWMQKECKKQIEDFGATITIMPAPLCDTQFLLQGDQFLKAWREEVAVESDVYRAKSVDVRTEAEQLNQDSEEKSNIINSGNSSALGGSAPAEITFYAYTTDAVIHHEWQMASDEAFEDITYRFNQQDLDYVFDEEGSFYLRYIGSNSDGSCEVYSDVYAVSIGASELKCPNAFSPGVTEGVNDEWKVGYKSIVEFECTIFNRWGVEMFHFTDPSLGWDGKYNGKFVKPGVYYYVIRAKGADGKIYKMSGDINIIGYKEQGSSSDNGSQTE